VNGEPFRGFESHPLRHISSNKVKGKTKKKERSQVAINNHEPLYSSIFFLFTFTLFSDPPFKEQT
jgi:hypothetical protein